MKRKKTLFLVLSGFITLFTFSHASNNSLQYGETQKPDTLDPYTSNETTSLRISQLIFNGLVGINDKQEIVSELANSWEISNDSTEYTFHLRNNVFWHPYNGVKQKFTARDVAQTISIITHPKTQSNRKALFEHIAEVYVIDEYTIRFTLEKIGLNDLARFSFKILPAHLFTERQYLKKSNSFAHNPIGTGPYLYSEISNKENVVLTANSDYYLGEPKLKTISLKPFADKNVMNKALSFNALDMVINVSPRHIADLKSDKRFSLTPVNTLSYSFFAYNNNNPHLAKQKVRKALSLSLNREQMLNAFFGNRGTLISGPFPPGSWAYNLDVIPDQYNPEKAQTLLIEAGYKKKQNKYFSDERGNTLSFKLKVPIDNNNESTKRVILAYKNFLKKIGIKVNVDFMERKAWHKAVFKEHNFDITLTSWSFDDASDITTLFHSRFNGPWENNFISFNNKKIDSLIEMGSTTLDFEEKRTINHEIHKLLAEESPYTFLWSLLNYTAYNKKFKDVTIHPYKTFDNVQLWRSE